MKPQPAHDKITVRSEPEATYVKRLPKNILFGKNTPLALTKYCRIKEMAPSLQQVHIPNAILMGTGTILTSGGDPVQPERGRKSDYQAQINAISVADDRNNSSIPTLAGTNLVAYKVGLQNYGHILVEMLPRIMWLREDASLQGADILMHNLTLSVWKDLFDVAGIPAQQVKLVDSKPRKVENLVYGSAMSWHPFIIHPRCFDFIEDLKNRCGFKESHKGRKLFVARRDATSRQITNFEQVLKYLQEKGFEEINAGQLSFREQVKTFSEASVIVGIAGASMTNMVFAPKGIPVVALAPEGMPALWFWDLATHRNQDYFIIYGDKASDLESNLGASFHVEMDNLTSVIESM